MGKPVNGQVHVRYLEHPLGVSKPQNFEKESHVIYYHEIFHAQCEPFQVSVGRAWFWNYKRRLTKKILQQTRLNKN